MDLLIGSALHAKLEDSELGKGREPCQIRRRVKMMDQGTQPVISRDDL